MLPRPTRITVVPVARLPGCPVARYSFITATPISNDTVLIAGGYDDTSTPTDSARLLRIP